MALCQQQQTMKKNSILSKHAKKGSHGLMFFHYNNQTILVPQDCIWVLKILSEVPIFLVNEENAWSVLDLMEQMLTYNNTFNAVLSMQILSYWDWSDKNSSSEHLFRFKERSSHLLKRFRWFPISTGLTPYQWQKNLPGYCMIIIQCVVSDWYGQSKFDLLICSGRHILIFWNLNLYMPTYFQ